MDALFLIGLALTPGAAIGLFIWLKDRYDREPLKHLYSIH
jgi:protease PrsW